VRQVLPDCKIFLTLHEFLAICHHFGQMITTAHRSLCHQSSPLRCHRCFPEFSQADFFLRKRYIQRFFALVDCFIAPSRFLAERYIAWGVPEQKMAIIENVIPAVAAPPDPRPIAQDGPLRVGFFGQLSVLKGVNVLLDAADALSRDAAGDIVFEIFGDYRNQPPEFQKDFLERLPNAARNVHFHGPYDETRVDRLMQSVDAVVMPSIWWENSPIVIQEALRNRRPIICSDIGGMAEKVRDGKDGFHFPVGSATALAARIRRLVRNRGLLTELANNLAVPPSPVTITEAHMRLYRQSPSNCIQSSNFEQEHVA
jgi:glycosyltransferase involved in cell wall biosynthesis